MGSGPFQAFVETARTPNLRRAQLAFAATYAAEWALTIALGILAYRDGGATAVGIVAMVRMLPSALIAPLAAVVVDRYRRERVLVAVSLLRALTIGCAAATVALGDSPVPAYALAVLATIVFTLFRPAHSALLPSLCTTPFQLTSSNVVRGLLDSTSALLGPLAAAALLGPIGIDGVLAVAAAVSLWAAWLAFRVRYEAPPRLVTAGAMSPLKEAMEGVALIGRIPGVRLITGIASIQTFLRGCFTVFSVVVAIDLLDSGEAGVGVLTAAFGAGAIAGSLAAMRLAHVTGLARWGGVAVVLWGTPFALLAAAPAVDPVAWILIGIIGVGNALIDVALITALQRIIPDEAMGRVFAAFESVLTLFIALGSVVAPGLIALFGLRGALLATGLLAPVTIALTWRRLRQMDVRLSFTSRVVDLLRRVTFFSPLPIATVERLATEVSGVSVERGTVVISEGEEGDDVYVIGVGRAEAFDRNGTLRRMEPGDCFGEIAALGRRRRTSSVRAETDMKLLRLRGDHVVAAVYGYSSSRVAADHIVSERLGLSEADPDQIAAEAAVPQTT